MDNILQADDLRHEAGLYTVAATTARAMELFHEYQNAVPDNPMRFDRINRATLRGKIRGVSLKYNMSHIYYMTLYTGRGQEKNDIWSLSYYFLLSFRAHHRRNGGRRSVDVCPIDDAGYSGTTTAAPV